MGYWSEMNVNGYVFDVSIDGINLSRDVSTDNPHTLGAAAVKALEVYKRVYPIVECLNWGMRVEDEKAAISILRRYGDIGWALDAVQYIGASDVPIDLPSDIKLTLETAVKVKNEIKSAPKKQASESTFGYVYLLKSSSGHWKIGRTVNPQDRLRTFGVKLPFEVEYEHLIPCSNQYTAEEQLHGQFADKRLKGEWFDLTPEDVVKIKMIQSL